MADPFPTAARAVGSRTLPELGGPKYGAKSHSASGKLQLLLQLRHKVKDLSRSLSGRHHS